MSDLLSGTAAGGVPISGRTAVCGVIGDPIAHSLSPALYNAAFRALGYDAVFTAFRVPAGRAADALVGARALGVLGLSVTTPHKDAVARAADQRSATVDRLGAANCVVFASGVSIAYSTDGDGLLDDLSAHAAFHPDGRRCCVLGAGGAARSIVLALADAGASEVVVVNRTQARAETAVALAGGAGRVGGPEDVADADLVVNATSIGFGAADEAADALAAELGARTSPGQLVVDLAYITATTPFLTAAEVRGAQVRNGLGMLVHQAAHQVTLMTGEVAPLDAMWDAVAPERREAP